MGSFAVVGALTDVHTSALNPIGQRRYEVEDGFLKEYVYLKGVASCVAGSWVTIGENGVAVLLAANAVGDVAVAMAAIVADRWGWFCRHTGGGTVNAMVAANSADNAQLGFETTAGHAGDGRAAGDQIIGAIARAATAGAAALTAVQLWYPQVNDATGS